MRSYNVFILIFFLIFYGLNAQQNRLNDTINILSEKVEFKKEKAISIRKKNLIKNPLTPSRAAFYSAVLPGLGQAYIGKSWKIPIVYGAIGASLYYYKENNKQMQRYRMAYKRRLAGFYDDDFIDIIPENKTLIDGMNFHKSYRDISMIFALGLYMLNILDANVSAHMIQFNVNENLSLNPKIIMGGSNTGIALSIKFR